jgi:hypothetical protein
MKVLKPTTATVLAAGIAIELYVGGSCISAQAPTPTLPIHHCDAVQPHAESEPQPPTVDRPTITFVTSADHIKMSLPMLALYPRMIDSRSGNTFKLA